MVKSPNESLLKWNKTPPEKAPNPELGEMNKRLGEYKRGSYSRILTAGFNMFYSSQYQGPTLHDPEFTTPELRGLGGSFSVKFLQ